MGGARVTRGLVAFVARRPRLCAAHVVDHTADLDAQVRAAAPGGVPAFIHLASDLAQLAGLLSAGTHVHNPGHRGRPASSGPSHQR